MSLAFRIWWKQHKIAIYSEKLWLLPTLFSSLLICKLVLACFEWKYLLCPLVLGGWYWAGMSFVTPEWCISNDLSFWTRMSYGKYGSLQRLACFSSPVLNFVFKLFKEHSESIWSGICVQVQVPIIAGFSKSFPHVVFLFWQVCSLGGWAALFFHPNSPVTPVQSKVAAFTAATFVQRSSVCGCASAGVCECGRCVQSLQSHQARSKEGVEDPHLSDSPLSGDWFDLCS